MVLSWSAVAADVQYRFQSGTAEKYYATTPSAIPALREYFDTAFDSASTDYSFLNYNSGDCAVTGTGNRKSCAFTANVTLQLRNKSTGALSTTSSTAGIDKNECTTGYLSVFVTGSDNGTCLSTQCPAATAVATGFLSAPGSSANACIRRCRVTDTAPGAFGSTVVEAGATTVTIFGGASSSWNRSTTECAEADGQNTQANTKAPTIASNGNSYQFGTGTASGCGYYNGEYQCLGSVTSGCSTTPDGAFFCTQAAASPPVPKAPDGVTRATPDATVSGAPAAGGSTVVQNFYSVTTVNNAGSGGTTGSSTGGGSTGGTTGGSTGGTTGETTGGTTGTTGGGTTGGTTGGTGSISGGGDCVAAPICEGDPISCFVAQKAWESQCAYQVPTAADADTAINAGLGVADNDAPLIPQAGTFDVSGFFNPGAASTECPEDLVISLGTFGNVTVPVSSWCDVLHVIGLLVLASAALKSTSILIEAIS